MFLVRNELPLLNYCYDKTYFIFLSLFRYECVEICAELIFFRCFLLLIYNNWVKTTLRCSSSDIFGYDVAGIVMLWVTMAKVY